MTTTETLPDGCSAPDISVESLNHEVPLTYTGPRVDLFVIPGCPQATLAETLLRVTLNELGLPKTPVLTTVIETTAEAIRRKFMGSPSITINGIDPWAQPHGEPALACRLYGSPTGLPTQHSLAQALCAAVVNDHPGRIHQRGDTRRPDDRTP